MNPIYITAFLTILRKEVTRFTRIWIQTILPPAITSTLYFIIFGSTLGKQIGFIHGYSYIQYIAPGLILMSVITNSYANVVASFFGLRFSKSIEELLVAPIPNALILIGFTTAGVLRGLVVGVLVSIIALFFTHLQIHNFLVMLSISFFSALLFSLAGLTNGIFARNFDDISIIPTFVLTPLTYLGGIFYPLSFLPSPWHMISLFNPILYMVNAFRYGLLGVSDVPLISAFSILIGACILLFAINLRLLNKGTGVRT